jgi:DNA-directed RNA polymerase subunit H (RpoH/RPB5)
MNTIDAMKLIDDVCIGAMRLIDRQTQHKILDALDVVRNELGDIHSQDVEISGKQNLNMPDEPT